MSIDDVENIEMDSEKQNGDIEVVEEDDKVHLKSTIVNPDLRRESIAEIKRIAEGIVAKGDGRGPLCSVDSGNMNLSSYELRSSVDENQPVPQHTSVIVTNPSVDLAASGSPLSGGTTGINHDLFIKI